MVVVRRASPYVRDASALPSHGRWLRRRLGRVLLLLQVCAAVLALQVSGFPHLFADAVFHDDCAADCDHESSPGDDGDSDCPPGCPTCHACAHAQAMYVPRAIGALVPPAIAITPPPTESERAPTLPFSDSVYRPPRA